MNAYWMRWLDFGRLAGLLAIVASSSGTLTPSELERIAIEKRVFIASSGKPLGKSNRYQYRRALERFDLVRQVRGRYFFNLTEEESDTIWVWENHGDLDDQQRRFFADRAVRNTDCFDVFWSAFVSEKRLGSIDEFISTGQPVRLLLDEPMEKPPGAKKRYPTGVRMYRADQPDCPIIHEGYNAVQAIHFGMRSWGIEQLQFLDELYQVGRGHHIFPVGINYCPDPALMDRAAYAALQFEGDWAVQRVSDILLAVASQLKVPILVVKNRLQHWLRAYSGDVAPIRVSERMIFAGSGRSERIRQLIYSGFLTPPGGGLVSHLRVHKTIASRFDTVCLGEGTHESR